VEHSDRTSRWESVLFSGPLSCVHTEEVTGSIPVSPTAKVQVEALSEEIRQSLLIFKSVKSPSRSSAN
jgi:hypothetical protein